MIKYIIIFLVLLSSLLIWFIISEWWILSVIMCIFLLGTLYEFVIKFTFLRTSFLQLKDITPRVYHSGISLEKILNKEEKSLYNWIKLTNSLKEKGLIRPLLVKKTISSTNIEYRLIDGNHRFKVLKYLYGEDHYVRVRIITKTWKKYE